MSDWSGFKWVVIRTRKRLNDNQRKILQNSFMIGAKLPTVHLAKYHGFLSEVYGNRSALKTNPSVWISGFRLSENSCSYMLYQLGNFIEAHSFRLTTIVKLLPLKQKMQFPAALNIKDNHQVHLNVSLVTAQKINGLTSHAEKNLYRFVEC